MQQERVTNKHLPQTLHHTNISYVSRGKGRNDPKRVSVMVLAANTSVQYKVLWLFWRWGETGYSVVLLYIDTMTWFDFQFQGT